MGMTSHPVFGQHYSNLRLSSRWVSRSELDAPKEDTRTFHSKPKGNIFWFADLKCLSLHKQRQLSVRLRRRISKRITVIRKHNALIPQAAQDQQLPCYFQE
ncbi:hypothetical protein CEXT_103701 [Caerostris extrusa]|uniref:Uncharacterized protein n=1 Tax=Caerostris extrusa TaxID=172846 RepID=A0AAV4R3J4_CAEEX|nr:hypothetical protein CEXT_103701 [Caerostris extrusa]